VKAHVSPVGSGLDPGRSEANLKTPAETMLYIKCGRPAMTEACPAFKQSRRQAPALSFIGPEY